MHTLLGQRGVQTDISSYALKRVIQQKILDPLSMKILDGTIHEGQTIKAVPSGNGLKFTVN